MYFFLLNTLHMHMTLGMNLSELAESEPIKTDNDINNCKNSSKLKKFTFKRQEMNIFFKSLDRLNQMNNCLIQYIENFRAVIQNNDYHIDSRTSFEEFIHDISEKRKSAEKQQVCEYEYIKLCELFYRTLYFIIKHKQNFQIVFVLFSKNAILPILKKIKFKLIKMKFYRILYSLSQLFCVHEADDKDRCLSLLNFCQQFLETQNKIITIDQIHEHNSIDDLILLCSNVFTRFYLCKYTESSIFYENFIAQKYPISDHFIYYLFRNAEITSITSDARVELRKFYIKYRLDIEAKFLKKKLIPPISDVINKHSSTLGLAPIGIKKF